MSPSLGALEENVLLLVAATEAELSYAYRLSLLYQKHLSNSISISALHTVLTRLEEKGLLSSTMSKPSTKRGGRRKRIFRLTTQGYTALQTAKEVKTNLWSMIPKLRYGI